MHRKFTGRVGSSFESVIGKNGLLHHRLDRTTGATRDVLSVGGGCSEVLTGSRLAKVLKPSFDLQLEMMNSLENDMSANCLSNHTSGGVAQGLDKFTEALNPHLPWSNDKQITKENNGDDDWFISLQTEGASAVWAACDLLMQLQHQDNSTLSSTSRRLVAVGARSYHGPGSTSFGSASPLGNKPGQISYPVPSILAPPSGSDLSPETEAMEAIDQWFNTKSDDVAVLLVEPQWGSSQVALPWNPKVLHHLVLGAKERGIKVCADEIMCGLGRHGKGGMFASSTEESGISNLVDAVTFGKAIAGGCGDLLSGVAVKQGAELLQSSQRSVLQSHTYAGASTRALSIACEVLNELPSMTNYVKKGEEIVLKAMNKLEKESNGTIKVQGQGLLWGGIFASLDIKERHKAVSIFRTHCDRLDVQAYPVGDGFMITPPLDAALCGGGQGQHLEEAMDRVVEAALATVEEMGWLKTPPPPLQMGLLF
mmetsp:Transcript_4965/g.6418  ORF Transcript_4965/g.6418 Transcript_4965/m.6418 type:complete len:481 (+) Transcript_4965:50-1492(+)